MPFFKPGIASHILEVSPNESDDSIGNQLEDQNPEENQEYHLEDCANDIIEAIHNKDAYALADALREAFQKLEAEPHEESPEMGLELPEGEE